LLHRSQHAVVQALDRARQLLPFGVLGLDTDNGGEFVGAEVLTYCEREQLTLTRGRAHKKNDQCVDLRYGRATWNGHCPFSPISD
jgi:hypothetical protein